MRRFIQELDRRVLVFDGAMGTSIQGQPLDVDRDFLGCENCSEILVQSRPELIQSIHESFLAAGADAVQTNTFGANPLVLADFDLAEKTYELNRQAVQLAQAACARFATAEQPRYVIGSIGPGTKLVTLGQTTWDQMLASYRQQVRGLVDGGVDVLLIETAQDLLQVKCAINAALDGLAAAGKTSAQIPIMVQVTIETTGTMLLGTEISAVARALGGYPILSLGLNCATGPEQMAEHVAWLARHWHRRISVLPNAGLPVLAEGQTRYPLQPGAFARALSDFVDQAGVHIVGGCCGTTPEHIRQLVETIGHRRPGRVQRTVAPPGCTSLYGAVEYRQEASILNIGERTNASGSRAFKRLLEAEDIDGIVSLARSQVREGSHLIDINVDYAGRDNAADMALLVGRLASQVNVPLVLDSTQVETIEAGLKQAGGKCLINSANLEEGESRFAAMCGLARRYGAGLVLGCIDEDPNEGMARTAHRKEAIALRMYELATGKYGLSDHDLFFDPLVLPITTGMEQDRRSGLETIEATGRLARRLPRCQLTCGLSNISFGLRPATRLVLNSAFLAELIQAGMTSAILHVSKILPKNRIPQAQWDAALDLIYDRRPQVAVTLSDGTSSRDPLQIFIDLFTGAQQDPTAPRPLSDLPLPQRLRQHIIDGEKQHLTKTLDEAMGQYAPLAIINDHLLAGMKVVGELFGSGQMQLPFVLQSAEVMKMAVTHLDPHMEKVSAQNTCSIVLATVKGDVHDIGKNLVDIILTNNGYKVYNLGIKQPVGQIIDAWRSHGASAIGLSGLLVKSVNVMEQNLIELKAKGVDVPVLLGGAALSRHYCESHLRPLYDGNVYYGRDAFEGLLIMDHLASNRLELLSKEIDQRLAKRALAQQQADRAKAGPATAVAVQAPSDVDRDVPVPRPPFFGGRVVDFVEHEEIYPYVNKVALYRGQWQFKKGRLTEAAYREMVQEKVEPIFRRLCEQCRQEHLLEPKVIYGYFPCAADGDELIIFDSVDHERPINRFTFPRQAGRRRLCISDFFRPVDGPQKDVIGMTCVTMGRSISQRTAALFEADQYTEYLYLHGFAVECAEALAEFWHRKIRQELGIAGGDGPTLRDLIGQKYTGSRYSFGYPACPDMSDQRKLFDLLKPQRIGCQLTDNWQIEPEQSTSAIVVHHRQAKYFNV